jgi:hypothetical protein
VHGLTSEGILTAWELCTAARPVERPLALLVAAGGDRAELAALPLGERDARVLELRARTFGPVLDVFVACPACGDHLEFSLEVARLAEPPMTPEEPVLALDDGVVELRLLDTRDLAAAAACDDGVAASATLLERSIVSIRRGGASISTSDLTDSERARLAERLGELDPRADILLDATCPTCAHVWQPQLDPTSFVFAEITVAARRLLTEVATLARAFGWTESTVLSLTPARRLAYLELADARADGLPA